VRTLIYVIIEANVLWAVGQLILVAGGASPLFGALAVVNLLAAWCLWRMWGLNHGNGGRRAATLALALLSSTESE
jgi:hypothetical protein